MVTQHIHNMHDASHITFIQWKAQQGDKECLVPLPLTYPWCFASSWSSIGKQVMHFYVSTGLFLSPGCTPCFAKTPPISFTVCPLFKVLLSSRASAFLIIPCKSAAHILTPERVKGFQSLASIRFPCHNILCCCVSSSSQFHPTKGNVIKLVQ